MLPFNRLRKISMVPKIAPDFGADSRRKKGDIVCDATPGATWKLRHKRSAKKTAYPHCAEFWFVFKAPLKTHNRAM
jgi:hypothetical protein